MSCVYLLNIGANMRHKGKARSPIFKDGRWVYVSFPTNTPEPPGYSVDALPFVHGVPRENTHADPVWEDLTYGDNCKHSNPRGLALKNVKKGDVLLFWGLLWENNGRDWSAFSGEHGWYLLGALRAEEIATPGQRLEQVSEHNRPRAARNPHFARGVLKTSIKKDIWVFVGDPRYSTRFPRKGGVPIFVGKRFGAEVEKRGSSFCREPKTRLPWLGGKELSPWRTLPLSAVRRKTS